MRASGTWVFSQELASEMAMFLPVSTILSHITMPQVVSLRSSPQKVDHRIVTISCVGTQYESGVCDQLYAVWHRAVIIDYSKVFSKQLLTGTSRANHHAQAALLLP